MRLPAVDRRSPAITTPPSYAAATIVVPWGIASAGVPRGRRSGAAAARKSVNDGEPGVVAYRRTPGADGKRRSLTGPPLAPTRAQASSLAALLDEGANEVLGVRLEDVVYFVEDRIDVLGQFLVSLRDIRRGVSLDLVDIVGLPLRAALTTVMGRHRGTPLVRTRSHPNVTAHIRLPVERENGEVQLRTGQPLRRRPSPS